MQVAQTRIAARVEHPRDFTRAVLSSFAYALSHTHCTLASQIIPHAHDTLYGIMPG